MQLTFPDYDGPEAAPTRRDVIRLVEPASAKTLSYRPLEKYRDLYVRFANTKPDDAGIVNFANEYGVLDSQPQEVGRWRAEIGSMKTAIRTADGKRRSEVAGTVSRRANRSFENGKLEVHLGSFPDGFQLFLDVPNLLTGMWLQLGMALAGHVAFVPCEECGNFIAHAGGGSRSDKRFCSDRCRVRNNRRKNSASSSPVK